MPDCTTQYNQWQADLITEAVATADWAVEAAEEYLARVNMMAKQALTMQSYQAYLACTMGGPMMRQEDNPVVWSWVIVHKNAKAALESRKAMRIEIAMALKGQ